MPLGTSVSHSHPLLHPPTLNQALTGIATNAAPTAIVELIRWLDSFHYEAELPLADLARLVLALDEAAQPQLRQTAGLYLSNVFGARSLRYKALGRDFHASLGRAYDLLLGRLALDFSIPAGDPLRIEILLRTVRSAAGEMKWAAFDYQLLAADVWQRAAVAYRTALGAGGLEVAVNVREGRETRSTIAQEFVRLVAMQCASLDQLSPERIEAADKLVRYLQPALQLSPQPAGGSLFAIDLETFSPPRRCVTLPEESLTTRRYFRPAEVVPKLGELGHSVAEGELSPAFAGLSAAAVTAAIQHLARQWGELPPLRQYRRHPVKGALAMATGLGFIRALISGEAQIRPAAAWSLLDASRNGFGVSAPMMDPDICRVGALVGAHAGDTGRWVLALVRRVRFCEIEGASVGLQTISNEPLPVLFDDGSRSWSGILCDPAVRGRPLRVACEPGQMPEGRQVFVKLGGRMIKLAPGRVMLSGPGFQLVGCMVV